MVKMICSSDTSRGFACRHPDRPVAEAVSGRFGARRRHFSCRLPAFREKFRQPTQVDGGHGHGEYQLGAVEAAQLQLPQRAVLLAVAEDGFDQLANDLTHRVAGMRVVRSSIALARFLVFCATCGVTPIARQSATKSAVS